MLRPISLPLLALIAGLNAGCAAFAASFDCSKASSAREKTVCSNPVLSGQDDDVAAAYTALRTRLSPTSADLVRSDQREWLHYLDTACPASGTSRFNHPIADCLREKYTDRLKQLQPNAAGSRVNKPVLYTRAHFVTVAITAKDKDNPDNPDFGTGEFSWPQIDNPSPPQAVWNRAVFAAAAAAASASGPDPKPAKTFDASIDPSGTEWVAATVLSLNDHFLSVDIANSTYGYGAAHPNSSDTYFSWLPQFSRPLTPEDVFRSDVDWKKAVATLVTARLKINGAYIPEYLDEPSLQKAIATEVATPQAWTFSPAGLTIHFGQYEILPYAGGMPSARLTWASLKPLLAPGFHPEDLPTPLPTRH